MIVGAPSSTKNKDRARDPEMHSTKRRRQRCFGMNLRIGVDDETALTHSLDTMSENRSDGEMAGALPPGGDERVSDDAGYRGAGRRPENEGLEIDWKIAVKRDQRQRLAKEGPEEAEERRRCGPGSNIRSGG